MVQFPSQLLLVDPREAPASVSDSKRMGLCRNHKNGVKLSWTMDMVRSM